MATSAVSENKLAGLQAFESVSHTKVALKRHIALGPPPHIARFPNCVEEEQKKEGEEITEVVMAAAVLGSMRTTPVVNRSRASVSARVRIKNNSDSLSPAVTIRGVMLAHKGGMIDFK